MKRTNKAQQAAEPAEGRDPANGNGSKTTGPRTQGRETPTDGLERVRAAARRDKDAKFTALLHHVTLDLLRSSYLDLKRDAAAGVDGVTWRDYGEGLEDRLADLHDRLHRGSYRTKPSRRAWIAKEDGRQRPLGIPALEDKIVQKALGTVLQQIYEADFVGFSYGFRPGRGQHDALDALYVGITQRKVNWVLDADIRGYFDTIDHGWLLKFIEHRVADPRVHRLIQKMLKAGVLDKAEWQETKEGAPQGAALSPLLANVYLHYVFDLWADHWRRHNATGDVIIVRYADDFVVGFQSRTEAERFLRELRERFAKFGLELHPDKTRLIEFGRFAAENRIQAGQGKPETFDFLGFTHYCTKTRAGRFALGRKPRASRMRRTLARTRQELRRRMHQPLAQQGQWLRLVVGGWLRYYAVPGTYPWLNTFRSEIVKAWRWTLHRQSQKAKRRWTWARMQRLSDRWLPKARILHPYPNERLIVTTEGRSRMR
jgi:RNA-directed DNA polymerase